MVVMAAFYGIRHRDFHPDLDRLNRFMAQAALSTIDLSGLVSDDPARFRCLALKVPMAATYRVLVGYQKSDFR
jgi:hypothetical protein